MKLVLVALAALVALADCKDDPEPASPTAPPRDAAAGPDEPEAARYTIESMSGDVDVVRPRGDRVGVIGQTLASNETVRTGKGSSVTLRIEDVSIRLDEHSQLETRDVTDELAEVELARGRAHATAGGGERVVRVRTTGSSAVAETGEGEFSVYNDGSGLVAVASRKGKVKLGSSQGDRVLAAGQRGVVSGNSGPSVAAVPREVLLEVNWPGARKNVEIRGTAEPGAAVRVNGNAVETGPDGAFKAELILEPGDNSIEVSALDLSGRQRSVKRVIKVREKAPGVRANTENIWQ